VSRVRIPSATLLKSRVETSDKADIEVSDNSAFLPVNGAASLGSPGASCSLPMIGNGDFQSGLWISYGRKILASTQVHKDVGNTFCGRWETFLDQAHCAVGAFLGVKIFDRLSPQRRESQCSDAKEIGGSN
jgi:hypothetical protein